MCYNFMFLDRLLLSYRVKHTHGQTHTRTVSDEYSIVAMGKRTYINTLPNTNRALSKWTSLYRQELV